jgi:hypothetical protein
MNKKQVRTYAKLQILSIFVLCIIAIGFGSSACTEEQECERCANTQIVVIWAGFSVLSPCGFNSSQVSCGNASLTAKTANGVTLIQGWYNSNNLEIGRTVRRFTSCAYVYPLTFTLSHQSCAFRVYDIDGGSRVVSTSCYGVAKSSGIVCNSIRLLPIISVCECSEY